MDSPLTPKEQNAVIEAAMHTYPMMPMPRNLTLDVMSRIQRVPAPRPFRLTWNDLLLSLVLAMCLGAMWFSVQNLPPLVLAQIRKESILFHQYMILNARWLTPVLSFALAGFFAALTIPYLRREFLK
jgi:hypothetical protein